LTFSSGYLPAGTRPLIGGAKHPTALLSLIKEIAKTEIKQATNIFAVGLDTYTNLPKRLWSMDIAICPGIIFIKTDKNFTVIQNIRW